MEVTSNTVKLRNVDMDSPKIVKSIIIYCLPLILINLIQTVFNSVDMIMLNSFDPDAVASVGATTSIIQFLVNTFFGVSTGVKVVLSHQIGAHEEDQAKRTVSTSVITSLVLGVVIAIIGFLLSGKFLEWTSCPEESFKGADTYMKIYFLGVPGIMLYNFASAIITTSGDTRRPLYYMIISGGLNVILNVILLMILPEKVMAVAIATAVSQLVGALLALFRLMRMDGICRFDVKRIRLSFSALKKIMFNGLPIAFCNGLMPLSNLQIQTGFNELGPAVIAGNSAASSIEGLIGAITNSTLANAVSVFVGYNLGARRPKMVKKSILTCLVLGMSGTVILSAIVLILSRPLASLYVTGEDAIRATQVRLFYNVTFYFVACAHSLFGHIIQAFGYSIISTVNSIVSVLGFRVFWMTVIYPPHRVIEAPIESMNWIVMCWPISWGLLLAANIAIFLYLYYGKFKKDKLKKLT